MRPSQRIWLPLVAVVLTVGFVVVVIWRIHSSRHQVDTATVYAGDLAATAIGLTLLTGIGTWWKRRRSASLVSTPEQVAAAADRLAAEMSDRWRQEAAARRIITPVPATVRWHWAIEVRHEVALCE